MPLREVEYYTHDGYLNAIGHPSGKERAQTSPLDVSPRRMYVNTSRVIHVIEVEGGFVQAYLAGDGDSSGVQLYLRMNMPEAIQLLDSSRRQYLGHRLMKSPATWPREFSPHAWQPAEPLLCHRGQDGPPC